MMHHSYLNTFIAEVQHIFAQTGECVNIDTTELNRQLQKHRDLPDTCFHVLNLKDTTFSQIHGTQRLFGVSEEEYSFLHFIQRLHPTYLSLFMAKALAIYRRLFYYREKIQPTAPHFYNVFLPMRLKDGKYYRVRQMSLPVGVDASGMMVLQLNIYRTGLEPYEGQPLTSFFSSSQDDPLDFTAEQMQRDFIETLQEDVFVNFPPLSIANKHSWNITPSEQRLLRVYADDTTGKMNFKTAAQQIFISENHARGLWNKELKEKMNRLFAPRRFNNIQSAAVFLRQMNAI